MGWLPSFGSSSTPADSKSKEAYEAPDRVRRAKCWDARDAYFKCLDKNNILDAIGNADAAEKACGKESQSFEQNCASSWVSSTHSVEGNTRSSKGTQGWSMAQKPSSPEGVLWSVVMSVELTPIFSQVQYFKQRRVAEYEKEQLLKRQEAEMAKRR